MIKRIIFLFIFFISFAYSQNFTISADKNPVSIDETFQLTFTYSGTDINSVSNFQPPKMNDFLILAGPFQSTSMQIINGAMSGSKSFIYTLKAKALGKFKIEPATLSVGNTKITSNTITIEVVKGSPNQKQSTQNNNQPQTNIKDISDNVFIRTIVDKTNVLKGEQITVIYKLYLNVRIAQPQISKLPSFPGFWAEELETPTTINLTRENYNGKLYNVAVLKKVALFPTESGELSITPFEMNIPVYIQKQRRGNSIFDEFFDDPFFSQPEVVNYPVKSNLVKVKVANLPATDITSFKGGIGNFKMSVEVDKKRIKQNDPINLRINISGTGNIKLIDPPDFIIPDGFEKYDPKINESINRSNVVSGKRTYEYLLIPRKFGKYEIPSFDWTYFDLSKRSYVTLTSDPISIDIEKGDGIIAYGSQLNKNEIELLNKDIRFIRISSFNPESNVLIIKSLWYWIIYIVSILGFVILYVFFKKEESLKNDIIQWRYTKSYKNSINKLNKLVKNINKHNKNYIYSGIYDILYEFLQARLKLPASNLNLQTIIEKLKANNFDQTKIDELTNIIQKCELIKFASVNFEQDDINEFISKVKSIINEIYESEL